MDVDDIDALAKLNVEVQFGIESGSARILGLMHKTRQPAKYLEKFRLISTELSKRRILHRANIIFNHPGETEETLTETFEFIDSMLQIPESHLMWVCRPYMHYPGCELDRNREHYEQTYGSRFFSPEWWREDRDQYLASLDSIPSKNLEGERKELWGQMLQAREDLYKSKLSETAFRYAAEKYYPAWQDDPQYAQV